MDKYITNDEIGVLIKENFKKIRSLAGRIASGFIDESGVIEDVKEMNDLLERIRELRAMQETNGSEEE